LVLVDILCTLAATNITYNINTNMTRVVIYARVSTNSQDYERQISDLREYAKKMDYVVVKEFSEKISGAKKVAEREQLSELLSYVEANNIDKVLIYECSRLSRRIVDFLQVIEQLTDKGISLFILQNSLETLQADGKPNPIAQLVLGMIAQFNSMERGLIRSRMESGYNHYRATGGKVGRKQGYKKSTEDMKEEYAEEIRLLKKGISLRNISKITHTSVNTLRKIRDLTIIA
jgi:DNA invertase Pin-like site-specific DNA recombinase